MDLSNIMVQLMQSLSSSQQAMVAAMQQQTLATQSAAAEQRLAAERTLARTAAGTIPEFKGSVQNVAVHDWCIAIERWFETAQVTHDAERITIATSHLREAAQAWWESEKTSGRSVGYNTWALFKQAIKIHFLPMDVGRWARAELHSLTKKDNRNINLYSAEFDKLEQLIPGRDETDKVIQYEAGLPEEYRIKCAEKRYPTLDKAMEAMRAMFNARAATQGEGYKKNVSSLNTMDTWLRSTSKRKESPTQEEQEGRTGEKEEGEPDTPRTAINKMVVESVNAVFSQQQQGNFRGGRGGYNNNRGGYSRGGGNGQRGGQSWRGRGEGGRGQRDRSRSPQRGDLLKGITAEVKEERRRKGLCLRCGDQNDKHMFHGCPNEIRTTN